MTDAVSPDIPQFHSADIVDIRVEQARLLKENARRSAIIVFFIVANTSAILAVMGYGSKAGVWFIAACAMILVTIIYARAHSEGYITRDTVAGYLRGHTFITALTGSVWGAFAIWALDTQSLGSLFVLSMLLTSVTLGGLMPGSIYRPGYIALCVTAILPFAVNLIFFTQMPFQLFGFGFFGYFAVATLASVQNEVNIRDTISSRLSRAATEEIARKNIEIEALMADKSRFVAAISHDLSQPMSAQRHFLAQLMSTQVSEAQRDILLKVQAALHNQERLLQDLVEMNRTTPSDAPQLRLLPLDAALQQVVTEFEGLARVHDLHFTPSLGGSEVYTDPKLLSRILRNLLSNAMKFTPRGGTVRLWAEDEGGRMCLWVEDSGIGIPASRQAQIFDEYVQVETAGTGKPADKGPSGLGLGLAIVKKLAGQLGIDVALSSQEGQGTRFKLSLPPVPAAAQAQFAPDEQARAAAPQTVLIIAPMDLGIMNEIADHLSHAGHRVLSAQSLPEAIEVLGAVQGSPNLLVCAGGGAGESTGERAGQIEAIVTGICDELAEDIRAIVIGGPDGDPYAEHIEVIEAKTTSETLMQLDQALAQQL